MISTFAPRCMFCSSRAEMSINDTHTLKEFKCCGLCEKSEKVLGMRRFVVLKPITSDDFKKEGTSPDPDPDPRLLSALEEQEEHSKTIKEGIQNQNSEVQELEDLWEQDPEIDDAF